MDAIQPHEIPRSIGWGFPAPNPESAPSTVRPRGQVASLGVLYAHAFAIEHEAEARYREFAAFMADTGNDATAELFLRLAEFEAQHALHLAGTSSGIDIPIVASPEHAWLDHGAPVSEARAFLFRLMTPRLALQISLGAEERSKAFFEQVRSESSEPAVRRVAGEFALEEKSHIAWIKYGLAYLPQPFQPSEEQPGDPTLEQRV